MAEKKFGVRDLEIIDPTGTPTIESSGDLIVNAGGATERLRITSSGNIGIGTDNPEPYGPSVHIAGVDPALLIEETESAVDYFCVNVSNGNVDMWYDDSADIVLKTATAFGGQGSVERLRVTGIGSVGVGLANPNSNLHVKGGSESTDNLLLTLQSNGVANDGSLSTGLRLINSTSDTSIHGADIRAIRTGSSTADLIFSLYNGNNPQDERLRITSDGHLVYDTNKGGIYNFEKACSANASTNIFRVDNNHGAHCFTIYMTGSNSGNSVSKIYHVACKYGVAPTINSAADTGAYSGNNFTLTGSVSGSLHTFAISVTGVAATIACTVVLGSMNTTAGVTVL